MMRIRQHASIALLAAIFTAAFAIGYASPALAAASAAPINASPAQIVTHWALPMISGTWKEIPVHLTSTTGATGMPFRISPESLSDGGITWLSVSPTTGTIPATVTIRLYCNTRLPPGISSTINVALGPSFSTTLQIPVLLYHGVQGVANPLTFERTSERLLFSWRMGAAQPVSQDVRVRGSDPGSSNQYVWSGSAVSNGNWLRLASGSGTPSTSASGDVPPRTTQILRVSADPTGLSPGRYEGTVALWTELRASNNRYRMQSIDVSLQVCAADTRPTIAAVTNGASLARGNISRGLIVTVWGSTCAGAGGSGHLNGGFLASSIGNTRLLFDGVPAPLLYAGDTQINAVVPYEIPGSGSVSVELEVNGIRSLPETVQVVEATPAIFSLDQSGRGPGAILNQNGALNSANNPAVRGSVIMMWATGEGVVNPPALTGQIIGAGDLRRPMLPVFVTFGNTSARGGVPAIVQYAGSAPGFVSGALQVNVFVPPNAPTGDNVPIVLTAGSASSPMTVTAAIR